MTAIIAITDTIILPGLKGPLLSHEARRSPIGVSILLDHMDPFYNAKIGPLLGQQVSPLGQEGPVKP